MSKHKAAIITVEASLEPGGPPGDLTEWIEYVNAALKAYSDEGRAPMRYADFRVIDARLCTSR